MSNVKMRKAGVGLDNGNNDAYEKYTSYVYAVLLIASILGAWWAST